MGRRKKEVQIEVEATIEKTVDNSSTNSTCDANKTFEELIIDNQQFVYSVVNKEFSKYPWDIREDLYSAGKAGLVYAATKFKPSEYNNKFISYAVHWIRFYINEAIGEIYHPIKLNQSFIYRKKKITNCIEEFKRNNNRTPTISEISSLSGLNETVVTNVLSVNGGKNFEYVSFQAGSNRTDSDGEGNLENLIDSKLVNEYLDTSITTSEQDNYELKDCLDELKKHISKRDYNIFIDRWINGLTYKQLVKKYNLNFASSVKYILDKTEKLFKKLVKEDE